MIEVLRQTGSTSTDLAARLRAGEAVREGDWLLADRQTAGRGRQGRVWFDGSGNFMGSTLVFPTAQDPAPSTLAFVAGLAVHAAVARFLPAGQVPLLKWPNDVMLRKAKLAGVLLEQEDGAVIVGIGVNLVNAPEIPGRETVALEPIGPAPSRDAFAELLAENFAIELERWRTFGLEPILRRWVGAAHPEGTALTVNVPGEVSLSGRFAGLAANGALQLRLADGTTQTIYAGEVLHAPPEG